MKVLAVMTIEAIEALRNHQRELCVSGTVVADSGETLGSLDLFFDKMPDGSSPLHVGQRLQVTIERVLA